MDNKRSLKSYLFIWGIMVGIVISIPARASSPSLSKPNKETIPSWIYPRPFKYDPKSNPDIFRPFITPTPSQTIRKTRPHKGPLTPLEKVQPSQLKLVGIVNSPTLPPMALVELPNGKGYVLRIGTKVGCNDGRVIRIGNDFVIIQEKGINIFGKEVTKKIVLKIIRPQGESK